MQKVLNNTCYDWHNHETWLCYSWLEGDHDHWYNITNKCENVNELKEEIKEEVEWESPTNNTDSLYAELINIALSKIDFDMIAKVFWNDYKDNNDKGD